MIDTPPKPRLAWAAFGLALCAMVGPGFHWSTNPDAPANQIATEAAVVGIVCALLDQVLGWAAVNWATQHQGQPGRAWAIAAIGLSGILAVVWVTALLLGRST